MKVFKIEVCYRRVFYGIRFSVFFFGYRSVFSRGVDGVRCVDFDIFLLEGCYKLFLGFSFLIGKK